MAATRTRRDVERQRQADSEALQPSDLLVTRFAALLDCEQAMRRREEGALWAKRQALVELAAVAESLAAAMPVPRCPAR